MGCLYIACLYVLPVLLVVSFFVDGWAKFFAMSALSVVSMVILFVKVGWIKSWLESYKHGVKLSKLSLLGVSPIHSLFTILSLLAFIYSSIWMILDSHDTTRLIMNIIYPIGFIVFLFVYYKQN